MMRLRPMPPLVCPSIPTRAVVSARRGTAKWSILAVLALIGLMALLWAVTRRERGESSVAQPLMVFCAASNQAVLEAIRHDYEREFGTPLQLQYGASQVLLASLEVSGVGDVYLPADDSYVTLARERNLTGEEFPLARMNAIVAVPEGNPKQIAKWDDLLRSDVRVAQASPESAAIGKLTREALSADGRWDALHAHTAVFVTTVNEVANNVKVGAVDAGIIFDSMLHDYGSLAGIRLPELKAAQAHVAAAVLKSSRQPERALHFSRYLADPNKGQVRYREYGFLPFEPKAPQ